MQSNIRFLWTSFTLREALLLGFCATFVILTRAALRLHFSLPGHSMFFMMFFLLMARGCVPRVGAPTMVGLISGLICMLLGMTKMGPLILANFVLPGVIVDIGGIIYPRMTTSFIACLVIGTIASASKNISGIGLDMLLGMEREIIIRHLIITTIGSALFGSLGSLLVPPVIRRLQANNLVPSFKQ